MNTQRFENQVALVTGGGSGIGFATAQMFAKQGATVALVDQETKSGEVAADSIQAQGGSCEFVRADLGVEADTILALGRIQEKFGQLDHLVNNAGIVLVKGIDDCSAAEWDRVINVNLRSIFLVTKYSLPLLQKSKHATVVNLGSVSSFVAQADTPAYVASKGGALMLSKALALDLAKYGIRVNCVCPGITDTPMFRLHVNKTADPESTLRQRIDRVPIGRSLSPAEIADVILYLSSEDSSGITGTSIVVDGGYTAATEWTNHAGQG
jgi:NAD(P)-dependent dehydrogenase (short-subunit alcohol dehydrogenase family)